MLKKETIFKTFFIALHAQIGNENSIDSYVATNNTKDLLLKGSVVEGLTETQNLINTPIATEITEDFTPLYPSGIPQSPAEFFYENELLRRKISEFCTSLESNNVN
jgi:hypothetical protein